MTMLVAPTHSDHSRRSRAVYKTLRNTHRNRAHGADSLLAELAMLALSLLVVASVIALRAWLHVPQL